MGYPPTRSAVGSLWAPWSSSKERPASVHCLLSNGQPCQNSLWDSDGNNSHLSYAHVRSFVVYPSTMVGYKGWMLLQPLHSAHYLLMYYIVHVTSRDTVRGEITCMPEQDGCPQAACMWGHEWSPARHRDWPAGQFHLWTPEEWLVNGTVPQCMISTHVQMVQIKWL